MTRFKLVDRNGIYQILDLQKDRKHILTGEENVELLNNLHQENQSLKFQLDECANNKLYSRRKLEEENEQLRQELQKKQEEERLYANEILELRKTNEEFIQFKELGGDY